MKITVFTPTHNRGYILSNLYRSLVRQTFHDFEWLIVDDGSVDDTKQLVQGWINQENAFPIRYHYQENGGKCRAINQGLMLAAGDMFLVVDSDDILTDDALEKIASWERELPKDSLYCGVSGNLGLSPSETPNRLFDEDFFDGTMLDRYGAVNGERAFAFYTKIHRLYLYPAFDGERFMTEAVAYNRMAHDGYRMRFYNDIVCVYEYREDGLTKAGNALFLNNPRGYALWLREREEFTAPSFFNRLRLWYSYYCEMTFCEGKYRLTKKQCAEYIKAPLVAIYLCSILHRLRQATKGR